MENKPFFGGRVSSKTMPLCPKINIVPLGPRPKPKPKPRARKRQVSEAPTWIAESQEFSSSVIGEMLQNLYSDTEHLTRQDRMSLVRLENLWSSKFDADAHRPEPNPRPLTPPPPRKPRKRAPRKPKPRRETKWKFVDVNTLPDTEFVTHRLVIPRLRPHWTLSTFILEMPAYIPKRKLLDKYFNWDMLDRLMAMDNKSGTVFFQKFVDNVVKENPLRITSGDLGLNIRVVRTTKFLDELPS